MSLADIRIRDAAGVSSPTQQWPTEKATTVINAGEPVKMKTDGTGLYVIPLADGDGVIGTTSKLAGIAATTSNQVTGTDGVVSVYKPLPGMVYEASPKVAGSVNTAAKILALTGKRVVFDLTSSKYTVDTAAADNANNAIVITGGDPVRDVVYFILRSSSTIND